MWPNDDGLLSPRDAAKGEFLELDGSQWVRFDGRKLHATAPFQGRRKSVIGYRTTCAPDVIGDSDLQWLTDLGLDPREVPGDPPIRNDFM